MTQQDIINELNKMVIGYNINWDMIKYDADKAIMKINAHLGAEYPMMSNIMLSPNHRYTIKYKNMDLPIFPERYILTVVIPFIATEVLARDEEFTTIYNKYAMDFENGLFDMFQNEFNKVLPVFRQDPDVGVFFSKDTEEYKNHKRIDKELPEISYNVYYHFNQEYTNMKQFTMDPKKYKYGSTLVVKDSTLQEFIKGIYAYTFEGWALNPDGDGVLYQADDEILNITTDIHLYAKWVPTCVLDITQDGVVSINDNYFNKVIELNIPAIVKGIRVKVISESFDYRQDTSTGLYMYAAKLTSVTLPRSNLTITSMAFKSPNIRRLVLPSYDYLRDYPDNIKIEHFGIELHNLDYLYIPYGVSIIENQGIIGVSKIQCEIEIEPSGWDPIWTENKNDGHVEWGVVNG